MLLFQVIDPDLINVVIDASIENTEAMMERFGADPAAMDEALDKGCQLLICHHPLIFGNLRSISGKNEVERCLIKAIKNDIMIYAIHTNLGSVINGVNGKIADRLGLANRSVLSTKSNQRLIQSSKA